MAFGSALGLPVKKSSRTASDVNSRSGHVSRNKSPNKGANRVVEIQGLGNRGALLLKKKGRGFVCGPKR